MINYGVVKNSNKKYLVVIIKYSQLDIKKFLSKYKNTIYPKVVMLKDRIVLMYEFSSYYFKDNMWYNKDIEYEIFLPLKKK